MAIIEDKAVQVLLVGFAAPSFGLDLIYDAIKDEVYAIL